MRGKPCEGARMRQRCAKELWPNEAADTIDCAAEEERRILMTTHSSSSMESSVHSNSAFCGSGCGASELLPGRLEASELPGRLDAVESGISAAERAEIKAGRLDLHRCRDAQPRKKNFIAVFRSAGDFRSSERGFVGTMRGADDTDCVDLRASLPPIDSSHDYD